MNVSLEYKDSYAPTKGVSIYLNTSYEIAVNEITFETNLDGVDLIRSNHTISPPTEVDGVTLLSYERILRKGDSNVVQCGVGNQKYNTYDMNCPCNSEGTECHYTLVKPDAIMPNIDDSNGSIVHIKESNQENSFESPKLISIEAEREFEIEFTTVEDSPVTVLDYLNYSQTGSQTLKRETGQKFIFTNEQKDIKVLKDLTVVLPKTSINSTDITVMGDVECTIDIDDIEIKPKKGEKITTINPLSNYVFEGKIDTGMGITFINSEKHLIILHIDSFETAKTDGNEHDIEFISDNDETTITKEASKYIITSSTKSNYTLRTKPNIKVEVNIETEKATLIAENSFITFGSSVESR